MLSSLWTMTPAKEQAKAAEFLWIGPKCSGMVMDINQQASETYQKASELEQVEVSP